MHTTTDGARIARAIESLRPCDEVLVVDHGSRDDTCDVARRFGARVVSAQGTAAETEPYLREASNDWIFCLHPTESTAEALEASLSEWKFPEHAEDCSYEVAIHEETDKGWAVCPMEIRLVNRKLAQWRGWKPVATSTPIALEGYLTRFRLP